MRMEDSRLFAAAIIAELEQCQPFPSGVEIPFVDRHGTLRNGPAANRSPPVTASISGVSRSAYFSGMPKTTSPHCKERLISASTS
jgi:hypothetical protein